MRGPSRNSHNGVKVLIVVAAVALVGGCGGGEPALSKSSADELHAQVAAARAAAGDGDRAAALEALDGLSAQVRDLEAGGSLAEADATALRRGICRARRKVREEVAAPAATATATPEPTATATATPAPEQGKPAKPGKGNGNGKAKGKAKKGKGG
jgi:hypothetical protein